MPEERLQKILAAAGVASRRASEALISSGRVRVNGRVATLGDQADGATAHIEVDGIPVGVGAARSYVALHKPAGVTATTRDRHAEVTVLDLVPTAMIPDGSRLYPVGRLDLDSEGLLLLTNDGTWADHVLHPRFGVQREYAVALDRPLDHDQARALREGIRMDEGVAHLAAPLRPATTVETRALIGLLDPVPSPELDLVPGRPGPGLEAAAAPHVRRGRITDPAARARPDRDGSPGRTSVRAREAAQGTRDPAAGCRPGGIARRHAAAEPTAAAAEGEDRRARPATRWSAPAEAKAQGRTAT